MKTKKVTAMTVEDIQAATAALTQLHEGMSFILQLTPAERLAAGRIGPKAVQITEMRLATSREHKDGLPPTFDLKKFEREAALFSALDGCLTAVKELQVDVRDTFLTIGRSAIESSKTAFAHLQAGAAASESLKKSVHLIKARTRAPRVARPPKAAAPAPAGQAAAVPASPVARSTSSGQASSAPTVPEAPDKKAA